MNEMYKTQNIFYKIRKTHEIISGESEMRGTFCILVHRLRQKYV
jgi:hypothetical protein